MDIPSTDSETHTTRLNDSPNPEPLFPEQRLINRRQLWGNNRFHMEMENLKTRRYGNRGRHHWYELLLMMKPLNLYCASHTCIEEGCVTQKILY